MFKVDGGHINPDYVMLIKNIRETKGGGHDATWSFEIILVGGKEVTSEIYESREMAVHARGALIRMISPLKKERE